MFGLFKSRQKKILSPVDGEIVDISSVPDEVFSQKMVGDGVAVRPENGLFCAPIDGIVAKIFATNHAFTVRGEKSLEVMVHIGLETVALEGRGFERLVSEGDRVKAGDPVIRADLDYISKHALERITPIVISEESCVKEIEKKLHNVKQGDVIMEVV
jgi:glucose-specific phosphotransferase system IIA component